MILVTGASGNAGGAVLRACRNAGLPTRAMVRSAADEAHLPAGTTLVVADFADRASLRQALSGIDRVFLACGPIPQLVEYETNMIEACAEASVRFVVLNSALGATRYPKSFPSWHAEVESRLHASGIPHAILRPNGFMQNIATYNSATIRAQNAFYAAMGDARVSLVDVRDVADTAAAILREPTAHAGKIHELNGPEPLSNADIAAHLTRATGRQITYVDIPEQAQREAMQTAGMPDWQITAILQLQDYYRTNACAQVDTIIAAVTGHAPRTLDAYLAESASDFAANPA